MAQKYKRSVFEIQVRRHFVTTVLFTVAWGGYRSPGLVCERSRSECEYLRSLCERSRSECKHRVQSANAHVRSANAEFGLRLLCSVCEHLRADANSKKIFFSYQISQLFLGGRFHGSIAACSNNRPPPSLG